MIETKIYIDMVVGFALAAWIALEIFYDEWRKFKQNRGRRVAGHRGPSEMTAADSLSDDAPQGGPLAAA